MIIDHLFAIMNASTYTAILAKSMVLAPLWKFQLNSQLNCVLSECQQKETFYQHFELEKDRSWQYVDDRRRSEPKSVRNIKETSLTLMRTVVQRVYKHTSWAIANEVLSDTLAAALCWWHLHYFNTDLYKTTRISAANIIGAGIIFVGVMSIDGALHAHVIYKMLGIKLKKERINVSVNQQNSKSAGNTETTENTGNLSHSVDSIKETIGNCWKKWKIAIIPGILHAVSCGLALWIEERFISAHICKNVYMSEGSDTFKADTVAVFVQNCNRNTCLSTECFHVLKSNTNTPLQLCTRTAFQT